MIAPTSEKKLFSKHRRMTTKRKIFYLLPRSGRPINFLDAHNASAATACRLAYRKLLSRQKISYQKLSSIEGTDWPARSLLAA
jgi:hypothetical protein